MKMSTALLAPLAGSAIALTATISIGGEDYCTVEGPDIITYKVADSFGSYDFDYYGQDDGILAYAVATTSGNPGNMVSQWTGPTGEYSPVIGSGVYRLGADGSFEQVGISWLKHSFCAVSEAMCNCQSTNCSNLGIGCADTYWAGLNADADAPRSEINPTTGRFEYPFVQSPCGQSAMRGKIQIDADDVNPSNNEGARYFVESQYIAPDSDPDYPDEYDYDSQFNNVSFREIRWTGSTNTQPVGDTVVMESAISMWADAGASVSQVWTPEADGWQGLMHMGVKVTDNNDGTWTYRYAVHNQNSHECAGRFSVPISDCVEVSNVSFHAPQYHSCELVANTDWQAEVTDNAVTWSTQTYAENEWSNPVRWGTMYSFSFDANYPPSAGIVDIGMWRTDALSVEVAARGPLPDCGGGDCPADLNDDGTINVNDVLLLIAAWNTSNGDIDGDNDTDVNDLLGMLEVFNTDC
ncbi:MAG: hypothetical protein MK089_07750 [Phycisphaerales bacterium]|nr:hypothetical protein [Phycisphaerales bacterium]